MDDEYAQTVAALMRGPLAGFVATRNDAARTLRTQGRQELAGRVAGLRKPSLALWALNQAAAVAADDLAALRAAGDRLRQAQTTLLQGDGSAGAEMSEAAREQRTAIDAISSRIAAALTESGSAASEETIRRVSEALRSASLADAATWSALENGRLLTEPAAASFDSLDVTGLQHVHAARIDHEAGAHRKHVAAAEAAVRRAEELESAAREQEEAARRRRAEATDALQAARAALSELQRQR